jgi:hypothetical protein
MQVFKRQHCRVPPWAQRLLVELGAMCLWLACPSAARRLWLFTVRGCVALLSQLRLPTPPTVLLLNPTQNYGVELGVEMCRTLLAAGVPGLHMYTLNLERSAVGILSALGVLDPDNVPRPLPWRHIPINGRRGHEVCKRQGTCGRAGLR